MGANSSHRLVILDGDPFWVHTYTPRWVSMRVTHRALVMACLWVRIPPSDRGPRRWLTLSSYIQKTWNVYPYWVQKMKQINQCLQIEQGLKTPFLHSGITCVYKCIDGVFSVLRELKCWAWICAQLWTQVRKKNTAWLIKLKVAAKVVGHLIATIRLSTWVLWPITQHFELKCWAWFGEISANTCTSWSTVYSCFRDSAQSLATELESAPVGKLSPSLGIARMCVTWTYLQYSKYHYYTVQY
jgi:hypothetical protein